MQRFCVVGGGGFIGTNLARHLTAQGLAVRVFGHAPRFPDALAGCERCDGEFADRESLAAAVDGRDVVVHLVGETDLAAAEACRAAHIDRYLKPTLQLLDLAAEGRFGRLVFVSSGGTVYGVPATVPIGEESAQWPIASYGAANLAVERYLHVYHHHYGVDYRVARLANPFGPYQLPGRQGVVATLLACSLRQVPFPLMGDGSAMRDFLYAADVADALYRLSVYRGDRRVFNVGSGVGHSLADLIVQVEAVAGRPLVVQRCAGRPVDVPVNILDVGRARRELGWAPTTGLLEGLRRTAEWMRGLAPPEGLLDAG